MKRPLSLAAAAVGAAALMALSACGGSGNSSNSGGSSGGNSGGGGGDFCSQAQNAVNQFTQIGQQFNNQGSGQTPSVQSFKQLFASATQVFDQLDSSAPSAIASDFHTLRTAMDQANSQAQNATTMEQLSSAYQPFSSQQVQTASDHVDTYMRDTCHITPQPSSS